MKIALLLTAFFCFQASAEVFSQKVDISVSNAPLEKVIKEIRKQSGYAFFYDAEYLQRASNVTMKVNNASINEALEQIFTGQPFTWEIINKTIVIKPKEVVAHKPLLLQRSISGRITDETGESLPGATIRVKNTNVVTVSDANGNFQLANLESNAVLVITYTGFATQEISTTGQNTVNVVLKEDTRGLDEIVVVGYGAQRREDIIGSVSQVTSEQLSGRSVADLNHALTGQVPGLTVTQSTGRPGVSSGSLRLRGVGSFGASPDMMVIIDGVPSNLATMNNLDPNTVESISVLKDASSAAIYGSRAANGVLLITTKTGKQGETKVTYNGYVGSQRPTALPSFLDSWEYAIAYNEASGTDAFSEEEIEKFRNGSDPDNYPNTKFLEDIIQNSVQTSHSLGISGGTAVNQYNLSLGFLSQNGLVERNRHNRYNVRLNMNTQISPKLTLTSRLSFISADRREPGLDVTAILDEAVRAPNNLVGIYSNGAYGEGLTSIGTPISRLKREAFLRLNNQHLNGNLRLDYTPIEGLKLSFLSSYIQENENDKRFRGTMTIGRENEILLGPSTLREQADVARNYILQGLADYNKTINRHRFNVLLGYSFEEYTASNINAFRDNFPGNDLTVLNVGSPDNQQANGTGYEWALESQFARVNYSYASKYLIEGVVRRDGSSRFPISNQYAIFPSMAIGWRIGEESFIKDNFNWINELKVKASRGELGNQAIGNYPYQNTLGVIGAAPGSNLGTNYSFGGSIIQGVANTTLVDANLKWESTRTTDVGIDFGIFENKITGSATYFYRDTYDILYSPASSVSNVLGLNLSVRNTGRLKNSGWEFTLNHSNSIGKFGYNIASNFSIINNEVRDLGVGNIIQPNGMVGNGSNLFIGYPMNIYYGFIADGLFVDQPDIDSWADISSVNPAPKPGDIRYRDVSGPDGVPDGIVDNTYDRVVLGSRIPKYTYGINLGMSHSGFDVSVFLQGVAGVKGYLSGNQGYAFNNQANIQRWQYDERWSPENPDRNATYPRLEILSNAGSGNTLMSSFWTLSGSYMRIKNAQIGYTFQPKLLEKVKISQARVYLGGENLHTFSNYRKGWDPEINGNDSYYPIISNYTLGVNITF